MPPRAEMLQAMLEQLATDAPVGIVLLDLDFRFAWLNAAAAEMNGLPAGELVGRRWQDVSPQVARARSARVRRAMLSGRPILDDEVRGASPGAPGRPRWWRVHWLPVGRDGQAAGVAAVFTETTAEREAREAAARGEEHLRRVLESISDAFVALDGDGRFTYVNAQAARLLRQRPGDLLGRSLWDAFPAARDSELGRQYRRAMERREPVGFEARYEPLGAWLDVRAYPFDDGLSVYFRDVTARRAQAEAAERQRVLLELALDAAQGAWWEHDPRTGEDRRSDRWFRRLGLDPGALPGHASALRGLVHPDDLPGVDRALADHLEGRAGRYESEHRLRHAGGGWRAMLDRGVVVARDEAGRPLRMVGASIDVSELREAQDALRRERDYVQALVGALQDGMAVLSLDGEVLDVNARFCEITGFAADELVGRSPPLPHWPPGRGPDDLPPARLAATGRDHDVVFRHRDGHRVDVILAASALHDASGAVTGYVETVKDVSRRRRDERLLRAAEREQRLLARVAEAVAGERPEGELFALAAREAADVVGAETMLVVRREGDVGVVVGRHGAHAIPLGRAMPLIGDGATVRAARSGGAGSTDDHADPGLTGPWVAAARAAGLRSASAVTVRVRGEVWGFVVAAAPRPHGFDDEDRRVLGRLGDLLGLAVANTAARRELVVRALSDPLTGLPNHAAFHGRLAEAVAHAHRRGERLALVLIDLDHFKQVNDVHGHQAGDAVLREVTRRLVACTRGEDALGRVGGEEIGWILPGSGVAAAAEAAERARACVSAEPIPPAGRVTFSAGVAELRGGADAGVLYARADGALYAAKHRGRDRVLRDDEA